MLFNTKSAYSLLQSTVTIPDYVRLGQEYGYTSLGLADVDVMHGSLEFYRACQRAGIKPLIGLQIELPGLCHSQRRYPALLYAIDYRGYQALMQCSSQILSEAKEMSSDGQPLWELIRSYRGHLVYISAGRFSELEELVLQDPQLASQALSVYREYFGTSEVYLGYNQYSGSQWERQTWLRFAEEEQVAVVLNQLVHTLDAQEALSLRVLECIGRNEVLDASPNDPVGVNYLYPYPQLRDHYQKVNLGAVIDESLALADRLNVEIPLHQSLLPRFDVPDGQTASQYLAQLTHAALHELSLDSNQEHEYESRLVYELQVIDTMGFSDYFLIVWDLISYCLQAGIRVGPGRGSAAGSLVSYLLKITQVDPVAYDLLFERFLNPERMSMPDIDIDIPDDRRDQVLRYVAQRYGHDQVAQICTLGTFGAKSAVRDTLRVQGYDQATLKRWARAIPTDANQLMTLDRAYQESKDLRDLVQSSVEGRQVFAIARTIEGLPRHISTHAAAVVIHDHPLVETVPVMGRSGQLMMTQFTMYDVEALGLLKMDFLGLRNLTILDDAVQAVNRHDLAGQPFEVDQIPMDDAQTLALFQEGRTDGIFQFESAGIRKVLRQVHPETFEDIVAVNALYRPGPMKQIPVFVRRKHGQEAIHYVHPVLEPILRTTYGIIVYQEQVMKIAQEMADFSLGEADLLRRAMGKKQADVMQAQASHFISGALQRGYDQASAQQVYDYIYEFSNYGFNRAHAVVYSMLAWQLAYLKVHYPLAFYQSLLNNGSSQQVSFGSYLNEAKQALDGGIRGVDINLSLAGFSIIEGQLRVGFRSVKTLRKGMIDHLLDDRQRLGPYQDFISFLRRLPEPFLVEDQIDPLIKVGAFDRLGYNRATLSANLAKLIKSVEMSGQSISLFEEMEPKIENQSEWSQQTLLAHEQEYLGFTTAPHPLENYQALYHQRANLYPIIELDEMKDRAQVELMGMIDELRVIQTTKGEDMAFLKLADLTQSLTVVIFPDLFRRSSHKLSPQDLVWVTGQLETRRGERQVIARQLDRLDQLDARPTEAVHYQRCFIRVTSFDAVQQKLDRLKTFCQDHPGPCRVILVDASHQAFLLNEAYSVSYSHRARQHLEELFGRDNVAYRS